jgi:hypothetical protein
MTRDPVQESVEGPAPIERAKKITKNTEIRFFTEVNEGNEGP